MIPFDYHTAFSRNIGWVTPTEQELLRLKRVAIAGLGGVGGSHVMTLTRLGIGAFHLADFDIFELQNFNRQAGASLPTIGRKKLEVLVDMARSINPELDIREFPEGINAANLTDFLEGVDLYVDSLDFFAVEARRQVFAACAEQGIPAITAAPLGMGAALLNFLPGKMTFEEYFRLEGQPEEEQLLRFVLGLSPAMVQQRYLIVPSVVNFEEHRGPSTGVACELCAGMAAGQAVKILLNRGKVVVAPHGLHVDAYRNKVVHTCIPWGNNNPLQQLKLRIARRLFAKAKARTPVRWQPQPQNTAIQQILELARWAPSGDNTQPWRFESRDHNHLVVHGFDTRDHVIYDLQGHASQLALGGLLETIEIAAQGRGLKGEIQRREDAPETKPTFDIYFREAPAETHPLESVIRARCTQRRPLSRRPLDERERNALETSVGEDYRVIWLEGKDRLRQVAKLLFRNAHIRLTTPEAYPVHRDIIEWDAQFSQDRIPDQAVGVDALTTRLMRWTLQSWRRVNFMNTFLGGTLLPRLQLDVLPALRCAAHFVIVANQPLRSIDDYVAGGRAMQRFWLTATRLGLQFQPEMTPLIFASYIRVGVPFTRKRRSLENARMLTAQLDDLIGREAGERAVYMGRVGVGPVPAARSIRLPLERLLVSD
ncbi:MAG: ThiF family adenylyltransferase [Candidatus Competibacteraceae bacterium]